MKPGDAILATSRGDAATAIAYGIAGDAARQDFMREYIDVVFDLCAQPNTPDAAIVIAQSSHETSSPGPWQSFWWKQRGNPAGLGVTGDRAQDARSPTFATGTEAARGQTSHLLLYSCGEINAAGLTPADDPRYDAYVDAHGTNPTADTIAELAGTWATDRTYAAGVCRHGNTIWPHLPDQNGAPSMAVVFGNVPYPDVIESHLPLNNPMVQDGAPDIPEAVFWHRMIGTWQGTNGWFHAGHAATAYGVSVKATDGQGGKIYEWISRESGWYGESSGPAVGPNGDGAKLIAHVGVAGVNRTTKAIEISGDYGTPLDEDARDAIVALTAYFADRKGIPWDQFPIIPGTGRSFVCWHNEITGQVYKLCPGAVVMGETPALIERVVDLLKHYQVGADVPKPPSYATPILPAWWDEALEQDHPGDRTEAGVKLYALRRNFVATAETRRLDRPGGRGARRVGPNLKAGEKVSGERWRSDKFLMTTEGHYIVLSKLSPRVTIKAVEG